VVRNEVFNSLPLREFLEIDKNCSDAVVNHPELLVEIKGFMHSIRDFHISAEQGVKTYPYIRCHVCDKLGYERLDEIGCIYDKFENAMGERNRRRNTNSCKLC
jgi:hypothetical protein